MTNEEMVSGRFARWARIRRLFAAITGHLQSGGRVQVSTYTRSTVYSAKHVGMFRADKSDLYAQHGKRWDCITHCGIRLLQS